MKYILKNKKYLMIVLFVFALLSISIGYAFLSRQLKVNGNTGLNTNTWSVSFANITPWGCNAITENPVAYVDGDT